MMKFVSLVLVIAAAVQASELTLRDKITQSLENLLELEAKGIENCENKCDKAFNRMAYLISAVDGRRTFEFTACVQGCGQCATDLTTTENQMDSCFRYCKDYPWKENGIVKGVIEPDKACIGGCIINTCQVVCEGGTTDTKVTPANKQFWYPNGGCSIKTQPYSQSLEYVPWDSPNTGQGGDSSVAQCCANALSLCQYVGSTTTTNYVQLLQNTARICKSFVSSGTQADICGFFNNIQNCGGA